MVLRLVYGEKEERPVMAKSKKSTKKPSVKVQDLEPEADPKGGAVDMFLKLGANPAFNKYQTAMNKANTGIKIDGVTTSLTDVNYKFHK